MQMHNPPHPGVVLYELYMKPLQLSVTKTALALGISRKTLSEIVNGRAAITPETAMRIGKAFGISAQSWLNGQAKYDLWQLKRMALRNVKRIYTPDSSSLSPLA